jgi:hypothetical protein
LDGNEIGQSIGTRGKKCDEYWKEEAEEEEEEEKEGRRNLALEIKWEMNESMNEMRGGWLMLIQ